MSARSKARKHAFEVLFEAELREDSAVDVLVRRGQPKGEELAAYPHAVRLVEGAWEHRERIDELIGTYTVDWPLERMPAVDRTILRLGIYELLWVDDVPDGVVISEALALATEFSTDDSPKFVNGVLSRLQQLKPSLFL